MVEETRIQFYSELGEKLFLSFAFGFSSVINFKQVRLIDMMHFSSILVD